MIVLFNTAGKNASAQSCSEFVRVGSDVYHNLSSTAKEQLTKEADESIKYEKLTTGGVIKAVERISRKLEKLVNYLSLISLVKFN